MKYCKELKTKDGRALVLKNAEKSDAKDYINYFNIAHSETDFLTSYPDESQQDEIIMGLKLDEMKNDERTVEICAFVDGILVGSAGFDVINSKDKTKHRCEFGISIEKEYWGLGIGKELMEICIDLAKEVGYLQMELDVVADNESAINLYKKFGFIEFGRNPLGFKNRQGQWQELVLMRLEL